MKKRLDVMLVENNICETREKSKRNIMAGNVIVNDCIIDKPGTLVDVESKISLKKEVLKYVSRGGFKLEKAVMDFDISLLDSTCIDVGASTGGFTDCMLKNGAKKVFAIDVGYGQLDWKLRTDSRVICLERTNIRYLDNTLIANDIITFASIDVSFISLRLVLPVVKNVLENSLNSDIICLIKPQFEAGREEVKKNGVIKDKQVHLRVINEIVNYAKTIDLYLANLSFSPITGPKGNIEFLAHFKYISLESKTNIDENLVSEIVENAHKILMK